MIEQDISALVARDGGDLSGLEADVWRREREVRASQKAARTLASLQAIVVAFSIVSSAAAGVTMATNRAQARSVSYFSPGSDLAPSSLLFGGRP